MLQYDNPLDSTNVAPMHRRRAARNTHRKADIRPKAPAPQIPASLKDALSPANIRKYPEEKK
jgi:hypothetical protein